LDATPSCVSSRSNMLLSFQRPWRPGNGASVRETLPEPATGLTMKKASPERGRRVRHA
jgi:hypothetical protein